MVFENQFEQIHWFLKITVNRCTDFLSTNHTYIRLVIGANSFSVDTDIQKQCALINVKVYI